MKKACSFLRTSFAPVVPDQRGVVGLLTVVVFMSVFLVAGITMVGTSVGSLRNSDERIRSGQSYYHAESGAEDALLQIKRNAGYGATQTTLTTTFDTRNRVETTVETVSTSTCSSAKQITASGYLDQRVRRIRLNNCPAPSVNADFVYAIQAGTGGINMNNNAVIYGTSYSNGNHTAGNNARVTGDVWVAGGAAAVASPDYDPANPGEFPFGRSSNPNVIDAAQSFVADTTNSDKLIKVSLKVKKFGSPSNATVRIVTDNNGNPSGSQVASGTLNASSVGSTLQFVDVSLSSPPTLTNGTKYWIVIDTGSSGSNYWAWASSPDNGLGNGTGKSSPQWRSSGSMTWNAANADFAFKAFMGSPPTYVSGLTIGADVHANTITSNTIARNAYYQTNNGSTIGGTAYPGSADPPQRDLPITDANLVDFKNQGAAGQEYVGDYNIPLGQSRTLGPMKIVGNFNMENNSSLTLTGTLWITGSATFSNNATIRLDAGYGAGSGTIVTDGTINISNNVVFVGSGDPNSFLMLASSSSGTGINVSNNATNIILAAPNGTIVVANNAGANALTANRLELSNNATVTYVSGLADVDFSAGPGGSFQAFGWQEIVLD